METQVKTARTPLHTFQNGRMLAGMRRLGHLCSLVGVEIHLTVSDKTNMAYDPAMALVGGYPREMETYIHKKPVHDY